ALELVEYARRRIKFPQLFAGIQFKDASADLRPYGGPGPQTGEATPGEPEPAQPKETEKPAASDEYETLELRIGLRRDEGTYELSAETNEGGESGIFLQKLPLKDKAFTDLIDYLKDLVADADEAREFGGIIRDFLFPPKVWNFYTNRLTAAQEVGKKGIRIQLRIDLQSLELNQIPWEYCLDKEGGFITLNPETTFVRYIPNKTKPKPIQAPDKVRLLIAMSSPPKEAGYEPLKVDDEVAKIRDALKDLISNNNVIIEKLEHTTRKSLWTKFKQFKPHILHFTGHGMMQENGIGALVFEDGNQADPVNAVEFMKVLRVNKDIKMVILSACQTAAPGSDAAIMGVAPQLVTDGLPAVIAMQFDVPEDTAAQFMEAFYMSLDSGSPIDTAVAEARIGAEFLGKDPVFWAIPVLFMRAPNGNIWQ
ncbi:MAG: CHAT domain-containing protein, partial [Anaerolineae bacterium]